MKALCGLFLLALIISGCASTQPVNMGYLATEATKLSPESNVHFLEIPSRGAISDVGSIAVNGGGAANQLRAAMQNLGKSENAALVITSVNPDLPKAHIRGALSQLNEVIPTLLVIYAGDVEHSKEIETMVKSKGMKYGFIDTMNKP
ncbi:hypothetical protein [Shewanella sp. SR44-3]|uniref:hypothetical protein n=1 Tax=Shewanella sp. SR44-3 TaxID=2760936 RepID=UPI0015FB432F|nr:hypothetical protein [Shewanella sp. SR44-3]MBB1269705.1 hypothetical protein [Shewanella sp. SR44-3]